MIFVRWTICSNLQLYIICRGDKRKDFKVTSLRLTSMNFSSHCRLPVLHSSNTMTISELFPHFKINACHPSCLIVLFFQYLAPPVSGTHYTTLILPEVGQHSWCVMKQSWNWTKICSKARLRLVYEAWNWTSWCCLHTYTCPDWKSRLEWTVSLCVTWKYMPEYTQQISAI